MIYVFCPRASTGARELAAATGGRLASSRGELIRAREGDLVVCWGAPAGALHARAFNNIPGWPKLEELTRLADGGLFVPAHGIGQPPRARADFRFRTNRHVGGRDFLRPAAWWRTHPPDFWVQKLTLLEEFRIHIWKGAIVRAGMKVPLRPDCHPWVRSHHRGWGITYDRRAQEALAQVDNSGMREHARKAVEVLGLDFGAVDLARMEGEETPLVLEVNRAPGLEGGTVTRYAQKVRRSAERGEG